MRGRPLREEFGCTDVDSHSSIGIKAGRFGGAHGRGVQQDVRIRILGDFAIIHARTSYTTADGQQAHGRYTDCWARQNGRWLAVSAHVAR